LDSFLFFFADLFCDMSSPPGSFKEVKAKKPPLPSRNDVDAKFMLRGVQPYMIREATGVEKMNVAEMRSLLAIFEEAHDRQWDVAKGPWAHAVQFYKVFFQATLPELESGPRESLIKDFLKRCWAILREREAEQGTSTIEVLDTGEQALPTEVRPSSRLGSERNCSLPGIIADHADTTEVSGLFGGGRGCDLRQANPAAR
jgi:hypothetical protein